MLYGSHSIELDYSQVRRVRSNTQRLLLRLIPHHAVTTLQSLSVSLAATLDPAPHDR